MARVADELRSVTRICSPRGDSRLHSGRKFGNQWWARDVYHIAGRDKRSLCGRDASEWLTIDVVLRQQVLDDTGCCIRCRAALAKARGEAS